MQKNKKSLKLNMILNMLLTVMSLIIPLITFPYVSNILSPVEIGRVSFAQSFISYFSMFATLGIGTYGIRACAIVKENKMQLSKVVHELLFIMLITSFIAYAALIICVFVIPKVFAEKTLIFVVSSTILLSAIGVNWLFAALEDYLYITIRSIVFNLLTIVALFIFVKKQDDYLNYAIISVASSVGANLINLFYARKHISFKWIGHYNLKKHIKPLLVFFIMNAIIMIYTNLDKTMLGFMVDDNNFSVGIYETSTKFYRIITSLCTAIPAVLLPRLSYFIKQNDMKQFYALLAKIINFMLIISIPIAVYFITVSESCILFIANGAYSSAVISMQIMLPAIIFVGLTNIIGIQMLVPLGKENLVSLSVAFGAVVDVILNACLIKLFASKGNAAIATSISTLCAEFSVFIAQIIIGRKYLKNIVKEIKYFKIIVINVLFILVVIGVSFIKLNISDARINAFANLAISASICFVAYLLILICCKEPIIMEILTKIKSKFRKKTNLKSDTSIEQEILNDINLNDTNEISNEDKEITLQDEISKIPEKESSVNNDNKKGEDNEKI